MVAQFVYCSRQLFVLWLVGLAVFGLDSIEFGGGLFDWSGDGSGERCGCT